MSESENTSNLITYIMNMPISTYKSKMVSVAQGTFTHKYATLNGQNNVKNDCTLFLEHHT